MRGIMHVIMRGIMVTAMHVVIHILQHDAEICCCGVEFRTQFFGVTGKLFCLTDDFAQAASATLHETHAVE